jgi:hypothetical protein
MTAAMKLDQFPDNARIWIYTSNRAVSDKEQAELSAPISDFLGQWAAHGNPLMAAGAWLNPYQLVVALDESQAGASGCSIDSQTRFMRELGTRHNIDWFDRLSMVVERDGEIRLVSFFELSEYRDALLYDPLVQRLGDIRGNWPVPLTESRYKHLIA